MEIEIGDRCCVVYPRFRIDDRCYAVRHFLGIRFFLKELVLLKTGASTIMTDNRASMDGVQNDKNHKGSHYMGYRLSWLREQVADLLVRFVHVGSTLNHADIFTKVLQEDVFKSAPNNDLGSIELDAETTHQKTSKKACAYLYEVCLFLTSA